MEQKEIDALVEVIEGKVYEHADTTTIVQAVCDHLNKAIEWTEPHDVVETLKGKVSGEVHGALEHGLAQMLASDLQDAPPMLG